MTQENPSRYATASRGGDAERNSTRDGHQPLGYRSNPATSDNGLAGISMGMSGDYESAIRLGATLVRVGTAIFGTRETPAPGTPAA